MSYEPQSPPDDSMPNMDEWEEWDRIKSDAMQEVNEMIDAALIRCAANSSLADAKMLAGYLNRGHIFEGQ